MKNKFEQKIKIPREETMRKTTHKFKFYFPGAREPFAETDAISEGQAFSNIRYNSLRNPNCKYYGVVKPGNTINDFKWTSKKLPEPVTTDAPQKAKPPFIEEQTEFQF